MAAGTMRYTTFKTRWGYFGLVCSGDFVRRTSLPAPTRTRARETLLADLNIAPADPPFEKGLAGDLQKRIIAYFEGENVDFSTDPAVDLPLHGAFGHSVLAACRRIGFGQTQTYAQLAETAGRCHAARAVGNALARNPVPLIIPCHRVVRTNGGLGGFSAIGGTTTKGRMLLHERAPDRSARGQGLLS